MRQLLKKEDSFPGLQVLQDILEAYPQIDALWLVTGKGEMLGGPSEMPDVVEESLVAYGKEQLRECRQDLMMKSEECGVLKCENDLLRKELEYVRAGGSDRGQPLPDARAG